MARFYLRNGSWTKVVLAAPDPFGVMLRNGRSSGLPAPSTLEEDADLARATRRIVSYALAALVVVAVVASLPPVQLAAVRLAAHYFAAADIELEYLRLRPRGAEVRGLRVAGEGYEATLARGELRWALWSSLWGSSLDVRSTTLQDVELRFDLGRERPAAESLPRARPPPGLAAPRTIPRWLRVRRADARGHIALLLPAGHEIRGPWQVTLAGIAPESAATGTLAAALDVTRDGTATASMRVAANASAVVAADRTVTDLTVSAAADPPGSQEGVHALAELTRSGSSERAALRVTSGALEIARFDGVLEAGVLDGSWSANLTPGLARRFARGDAIPELAGTSTGSLRAELAARRVTIESTSHLEGHGWSALDPRLAGLGTLFAELTLEATLQPGLVAAETLVLTVSSEQRADLLRVRALQPLHIDTRRLALDPTVWGEPAVRIEANALPLHGLRPFSPGQHLQTGELDGALDLTREPSRTLLVVARPLVVRGLQLDDIDGIPVLPLDITLVPQAIFANGALDAEIEQLTITAPSGLRADFTGHAHTSRATWPSAEFDGELAAHVPALQRLVPNLDRIRAKTRLRLDFETLVLTVAAATAGATSIDGRELLGADLSGQTPLRIQLPRFAPDWDNLDPQALALRLDRLPVGWVSAFLPELELRGAEVSGQLQATAGLRRGLELTSEEPLAITNLVPVYRGRAARAPLTATVRPRLHLTTTASSIALQDLHLRNTRGDELHGEIVVDAPAEQTTLAVNIDMRGTFPSLARALGATVGTLHWRQRSTLDPEARRFTLAELGIEFFEPGGAEFLRLENVRPFAITAKPFRVTVDGGPADVLRATVRPLRLERLLPRVLGFDLEGTLPQGDFFGRVDGEGRIVFTADRPLEFRDVTVRWGDTTLLDRVTTTVEYEIAYSADGVEARSIDLRALGGGDLLLAEAQSTAVVPLTNERLLERAQLTVDADLAALAAQPLLAGLPVFTGGSLRAAFDVRNEPQRIITGTAELRDATTDTLGKLPDLAARLDARGERGERLQFNLPLRIVSEQSGISELDANGQLSRQLAGGLAFNAELRGARIVMRDVQRLLELLAPPQEELQRGGSVVERLGARRSALARLRTDRHAVPIWSDALSGTASVAVDEVVYPGFTAAGVRGSLDVTPERLTLAGNAELLGAQLSLATTVGFDAAELKPYSLDFSAVIDDLELGELFRSAAPAVPPTAEGKFDVETTLRSAGVNPIDLALSALGDIRLAARDGVFRGFAANQGTGSAAARVIGFLTFSRELRALSRLLDRVGELHFENAEFLLERTTTDRIDVRTLKLLAPQVELQGTGRLDVTGNRPFVLGELDVSATLAARGDVAVLLDGMKLLDQEPDPAGYRRLTHSLTVGGTPAEPDMSSFWELLDEGADNARGSFGIGLRALNRRIARSQDAE